LWLRKAPILARKYGFDLRARVLEHSYSVSSRLIGCLSCECVCTLTFVELRYKGERGALMDRLIGRDPHWIDYRHTIHSPVRSKP
jgi:hypothetical protein